jgi:hypothetical protein
LDKRKVFLPSRVHGIGEWTQGVSWSAVQEEHDRIVAIIAFDRDPLVDASDSDKHFFLNWLARAGVYGLHCRILGKSRIGKTQGENRHNPHAKPTSSRSIS